MTETNPNQKDVKVTSLGVGGDCGPFRIEATIGQGGMGMVYRGVRRGDLELQVAIKILKPVSDRDLEQFQRECRILSALSHPNIARLIDVGTTEQGYAWLAMEYVEGQNLDVWINENQPSLKRRLQLFLDLCDALSHAHSHMIVHRDIKPGNIMICSDGRLKLLDFGIAAVLNPETGAQKTVTHKFDRMMTPEYASPEQINGERLTSATDVYSLGVVFYELLTGQRPLQFKNHNPAQIIQAVNQGTIQKPSTVKVSEMGGRTKYAAQLKGDLDTIALKALEKERDRRYKSVEQFSRDITLFMNGQPILARPATRWYRFSKLIGRHPWPLGSTAVLILMLLGFALHSQRQKHRLMVERNRVMAQKQVADNAVTFLTNMFEQVDPDQVLRGSVRLEDILEQALIQIRHDPQIHSDVRETLTQTMIQVYRSLGHYQTAIDLQVDLFAKGDGSQRFESQLSNMLAYIDLLHEAGKYKEAEKVINMVHESDKVINMVHESDTELSDLQQAQFQLRKAMQDYHQGLFQEARDELLQVQAFHNLEGEDKERLYQALARVYRNMNEEGEAIAYTERVLDLQKARYGPVNTKVASSLLGLSSSYINLGEFKKADSVLAEVTSLYQTLFDTQHPLLAQLLSQKAVLAYHKLELDQAEAYLEQARSMLANSLGSNHPAYADVLDHLGVVKGELGNETETKILFDKAIAIYQSHYQGAHPKMASCLNNYGSMYLDYGEFDTAELYLRRAVAAFHETLGERHPEYATALNNLAVTFMRKGELENAADLFQKVQFIYANSLGKKHVYYGNVVNNLSNLMRQLKRYQDAEPLCREVLALDAQNYGTEHLYYSDSQRNLADVLFQLNRLEEALVHIDICLEVLKGHHPEKVIKRCRAQSIKGMILSGLGRFEDAELLLLDAWNVLKQQAEPSQRWLKQAGEGLIHVYRQTGRQQEATEIQKAL